MFKNNAICQFDGSVSLLNIFKPFYVLPAACVSALVYYPMTLVENNSYTILGIRYIALILLTILLTLIHFYIYYSDLYYKLNFIVTKEGIIQKNNKEFFLIPWCCVDSTIEWETPYGWEISINTKANSSTNELFQNKSFILNQANVPFYLKKNKSAYLNKINTFVNNASKSTTTKLDIFSPFEFLKTRIIGNTVIIYAIASLVAIILYYFS